MHSAIAAQKSPVLSALVNGIFKEAVDRCVEWDDIDEHTFHSFWQYAYSGDYDIPSNLLTPPSPANAASKHVASKDALRDRKGKKKTATKAQRGTWEHFRATWEVDMAVHDKGRLQEGREPRDAAGIFIHHAKVHILADRYRIARLMGLSFQKLQKVLAGCPISDEGVSIPGIVGVLRFCCEGDAPEVLKELMGHYASCSIEKLWQSKDFQELVEDCGCLSRALIGRLVPRIASDKLECLE